MRKHSLMKQIACIVLIIAMLTIMQSDYAFAAAQKGDQEASQTSEASKKDIPKAKKVKNQKPVKIPKGLLNKQHQLKKWSSKKELIEARTDNSKTYLNEDGSKTTLLFFEPIHVKADKNNQGKAKYGKNDMKKSNYLEINNNLISVESGGEEVYQNSFGLYQVTIPKSGKDGIQINQQGISISMLP